MANTKGIAKMVARVGDKPHGSYLRYHAGCRCDRCRIGQREYDAERRRARARGESNRIVSAEASRAHLLTLEREHKVGATAAAYNDLLPAEQTRKRLEAIRATGMRVADINRRFGRHPKAHIATRKYVRHRTARRIRTLYYEVVMRTRSKPQKHVNQSFIPLPKTKAA